MSVEMQGASSGARNAGKRAAVVSAVVGAAAGAALIPAGAAQANIIGIGNAALGNTCVTQGGTQATGGTVAGSGAASGNHVSLPLNLPRNECGNSGFVCTALFMARV